MDYANIHRIHHIILDINKNLLILSIKNNIIKVIQIIIKYTTKSNLVLCNISPPLLTIKNNDIKFTHKY